MASTRTVAPPACAPGRVPAVEISRSLITRRQAAAIPRRGRMPAWGESRTSSSGRIAIGNGSGLTNQQGRGMGEGWSDFYALSLLSEPGDDPNGVYAAGAYATYRLSPGFTDNYFYGIRRFPYTTNALYNPMTFRDVDPTQCSVG